MPSRIIYMPLEGYRERYTHQWSAPKTGWLERNWIKHNIPYIRIEGETSNVPRQIKTGSVVDAVGRSLYCFNQLKMVLEMAENGVLKNTDVIYFDDFWHPGIEALPYAFHLLGLKIPIYSFCHAQSVDKYDFTAEMKNWIRPFERAIFWSCEKVFTSCPTLRDNMGWGFMKQGMRDCAKDALVRIKATGHPFDWEEVNHRMPDWLQHVRAGMEEYNRKRNNQVVWSSRWDKEKNPTFFLNVATRVLIANPEVKFVICTSAQELKSNDASLLQAIKDFQGLHPGSLQVCQNLSKEEYYAILSNSKIQFNCALQDWVAITLLEASVAGCWPVYPHFRSFPETFLDRRTYTYGYDEDPSNANADEAAQRILEICGRDDLWTAEHLRARRWIHQRFEWAWAAQVREMGFTERIVGFPTDYAPFNIDYVQSVYENSEI